MSKELSEKLKGTYDLDLEELLRSNELILGLEFSRTGDFENISRDQLRDLVCALGGKLTQSSETYLLAGNNPGYRITKAKELGMKIFNEKQFIEFLLQRQTTYKAKNIKRNWAWSSNNPPPPTIEPSRGLPGGGLYGHYSDKEEVYKKKSTLYIIKIRVPMKDGTECLIHKPGICVGKVMGDRYTKKDEISLCLEIKNLNRYLAENVEGKLLLIMKKVPWEIQQYGRYFEMDVKGVLTEQYEEVKEKWNVEWAGKQLLNSKIDPDEYSIGINKRRKELMNDFLESFNAVPNYPKSWDKKYGPTEWRIWEGNDEELKEEVEKLLQETWDKPYSFSLTEEEKKYPWSLSLQNLERALEIQNSM